MKHLPPHHIEAVTVNHNTSRYMELMLRSLFARHVASDLNLSVTMFDNESQDDLAGLRAYAAGRQIPIIQSGFTTQTENNSHGEVLRRFVLDHPDCTHYLFLDADVCFLADNTLDVMLAELEQEQTAFGIGPRLSWDGEHEIPQEARVENQDICDARLHPCCALIKNTGIFQRVVREVGLSGVKYLWADREEYLDTFKLMTKVMSTHGLKHIFSSKMVLHFFCVSYDWGPQSLAEQKTRRLDALLAKFRERKHD